jgi:hypothetical protein
LFNWGLFWIDLDHFDSFQSCFPSWWLVFRVPVRTWNCWRVPYQCRRFSTRAGFTPFALIASVTIRVELSSTGSIGWGLWGLFPVPHCPVAVYSIWGLILAPDGKQFAGSTFLREKW